MAKFFRYLKYIFIALVLAAAAGWLWQKGENISPRELYESVMDVPCGRPVKYAVGTVDPQFNLKPADFLAAAEAAEQLWETQAQKNLFEYDPAAELKINLVFDERQQQSLEAAAVEQQLEKLKISDDKLRQQYDDLYADYAAQLAEYNALVKKYENRLEKYNDSVADWNKKGGAPDGVIDDLQEEKADLEDMYASLEKKRKAINRLTEDINALVRQENKLVNNYNRTANTYQNKYGGAREFEKGLYDGFNINIYQFNESADLKLTLAHEIGHALGIGHVANPQSLMYYLMGEQDLDDPQLSPEDLEALKDICAK